MFFFFWCDLILSSDFSATCQVKTGDIIMAVNGTPTNVVDAVRAITRQQGLVEVTVRLKTAATPEAWDMPRI